MGDWHDCDHGTITEEKLVRAVHILADIVETNGPAFGPLYRDVRQQLADLRVQQRAEAAAQHRADQDNSKVA
jgi:hypothetical protein